MNWQVWGVAILGYFLTEVILDAWKHTPGWLLQQVFNPVRRQWKEHIYLRNLLRDKRFAQWKPEAQRYVALHAIKAQKNDNPSAPSEPLLNLLEDHLKRRESVLVLGDPGSGKTTALEALTYRLALTAYWRSALAWSIWLLGAAILFLVSPFITLVWLIAGLLVISYSRFWITPFFIELRAFFKNDAREFLASAVKDALGDETFLDAQGRCLLLMDGMNEIHRGHAAKFMETWRGQKTTPLSFFSCRAGEKPNLEVPATVEVLELDDDGVRAYLDVYIRERDKSKEEGRSKKEGEGRSKVRGEVDVETDLIELQRKGLLAGRGIGRNPYWLRMLVLSGLRTRNRGALFLSFARELIRREIEIRPEERKRKPEWSTVPLEVEIDALAELALAMNKKKQVGFEGETNWNKAQAIIRAALGDRKETPDDVLGEAESATLIRQRYKERIEFTHQLVQEFFAAYALRAEAEWIEAVGHCEESWWWETIFLLGGLAAIPEADGSLETWAKFTRHVLEDSRSDLRVFVAIGLLRSVEYPQTDISREVLTAFATSVDTMLTQKQQNAVQELGRILGDEATEVFVELFNNPNHATQIKGATLLCAMKVKYADEILLTALRKSDQQRATIEILISVGVLAIEFLRGVLKDNDRWMRWKVTEVLGKIGTPAVEPLVEALKDKDKNVQVKAAEALGEIGDTRAVVPLIETLKDKDSDWIVQWAMAEALGKIGDIRAVTPLMEVLKNSKWNEWNPVAEALVKIGKPALELLVKALQDSHIDIRGWAAVALGRIGDSRAVEPLIETLHDQSIRHLAASAIMRIGTPAVKPLVEVLQDDDSNVRGWAAVVLGRIGDPRAVEPLTEALSDRNRNVRETAVEALGKIGDAHALALLANALRDKDTRRLAAEVLKKIGPSAIEPLMNALQDDDSDVRGWAAVALGRIGDPRAVEPLVEALQDKSSYVCGQAACALGDIGDPRALPKLEWILLKYKHGWAGRVAHEAIKKIREKNNL